MIGRRIRDGRASSLTRQVGDTIRRRRLRDSLGVPLSGFKKCVKYMQQRLRQARACRCQGCAEFLCRILSGPREAQVSKRAANSGLPMMGRLFRVGLCFDFPVLAGSSLPELNNAMKHVQDTARCAMQETAVGDFKHQCSDVAKCFSMQR